MIALLRATFESSESYTMKARALTIVVLLLLSIPGLPASHAEEASITDFRVSPAAFNSNTGTTTIEYTLNHVGSAHVKVEIFDDEGIMIRRTIDAGLQNDGPHRIVWDGTDDAGETSYLLQGNLVVRLTVTTGSFTAPEYQHQWSASPDDDSSSIDPHGITTDSEGNVYVCDWAGDRVIKYDADGNYLDILGGPGTGNGQFIDPGDVTVDSQGNIYVVDQGHLRVEKFDRDGNYLGQWGEDGAEEGNFLFFMNAIAASPDDKLFVGDGYHVIQIFDASGHYLGIPDWYGYSCPMENVCGLAFSPSGHLYVSDTSNDHMVELEELDGRYVYRSQWGDTGFPVGHFQNPGGVAVDASGNIYVTDLVNRVQIFRPDHELLYYFGNEGSGSGEFNVPGDIAIGPDGSIYVSDWGNHRVQKFSSFDAGTLKVLTAEMPVCVDNNEPWIDIDVPEDGASYSLGEEVLAEWVASDAYDGDSGLARVHSTAENGSPIDTSPGTHTFTVEAIDYAGNIASRVVTYRVTYVLPGLPTLELPPLQLPHYFRFTDPIGCSGNVPLKLQLMDYAGNKVGTASAYLLLSKHGEEDYVPAVPVGNVKKGNRFRYDPESGQYIFNLDTRRLSSGEWTLRLDLDDGTTYYQTINVKN